MGFYLTEQAIDTATESTIPSRTFSGAKNRIGAPFLHTILSTKYWDSDTKILAYQLRDYGPGLGRWLSKDPLLDPGNLTVMMIRERVLGVLQQNAQVALDRAFDESATTENRLEAIVMAYRYTLLAKTIVKSEPLFWLQLAGENWIEFCANDTVNKIDSLGLVDILLNDNWDYIVMGMAFNEKDVFIVNAHSDGTFIYDYRPFTPTMLTPQDLADMIRRHPKYKPGMPVKLQACETGGKTFGPQLADILQATVIAPIGLWVGRSTGEEWFENPVTKLKDPSQGYIYIRPKIVVGKP